MQKFLNTSLQTGIWVLAISKRVASHLLLVTVPNIL